MLLSKLKFFIFIVRFLVHLCTSLVTYKDYFNDEKNVSWYVLVMCNVLSHSHVMIWGLVSIWFNSGPSLYYFS